MATQKPITILVPWEWNSQPKVQEWVKAGHTILPTADIPEIGLYLGPRCWHLAAHSLDQYGDLALKWAQEAIYGLENKKAPARKAPPRKGKGAGPRGAKAKGASEEPRSGPTVDPVADSQGDCDGKPAEQANIGDHA